MIINVGNTKRCTYDPAPVRRLTEHNMYVKAKVGGDNTKKNKDGSQNQTTLFERKRNG